VTQERPSRVEVLPVGARALLVELDGPAEVDALYAEIELCRRDGRLPALERWCRPRARSSSTVSLTRRPSPAT
jgi:hypothetical protein